MRFHFFLIFYFSISLSAISQYNILLYDGDFNRVNHAQLKIDSLTIPFDSTNLFYVIPASYSKSNIDGQPLKVFVECTADGYLPIKSSMYLLSVLYIFREGEDTLYSMNPMPCRYEKNTLLFSIKENSGPIHFDDVYYPCGEKENFALGVKKNVSEQEMKHHIEVKEAYSCFFFPLNRGAYRPLGDAFSMRNKVPFNKEGPEAKLLEKWKSQGLIKDYYSQTDLMNSIVVRLNPGDGWKSPTMIKQLEAFGTLDYPTQEVYIQACPD